MPSDQTLNAPDGRPWNKGQLIGQKRPLKPKDVWAIRVRLELHGSRRDVALFDLAIDSKLRACDLVRLKIQDVYVGSRARERATIIQKKTGRPVQFEISPQTRAALEAMLKSTDRSYGDCRSGGHGPQPCQAAAGRCAQGAGGLQVPGRRSEPFRQRRQPPGKRLTPISTIWANAKRAARFRGRPVLHKP